MANNFTLAVLTKNAGLDAQSARANGGKLRIYDGAQPANPDTAITTQNLLVEFTLPNPAFGAAASGVATANAITSVPIGATGTAAWFRVITGSAAVWDGTVGTSSADLILNSTALQINATASISSWTVTQS